jgi:putative transposase
MGEYMRVLMRAIMRRHPEIEVLEVNTDVDHVHLLVGVAPKMAVSEAVAILKRITARQMRKKFEYLEKVYPGHAGIWSDGYFVSTVGVNEEVIRKYIEMQGKEDSGRAELVL